MAGFGQTVSRIFFWSYERGSWQYDVAVILILIFVLLTKRGWFRDQPLVGLPPNEAQVELLEKTGQTEVYRVDARALAPPARTPGLQNDLHSALQKARPELNDGHFAIGTIEPVRDAQGNVTAYQVEIRH